MNNLFKPVVLSKYMKVGPEAVFALSAWMINGLFTNIVTFSQSSELTKFQISNNLKLEDMLSENLHVFIFNFGLLYLSWLYLVISVCNPGRIESKREKQYLNERFSRLQTELENQKAEINSDTPSISNLEDDLDKLLFNNYFEPASVINYKMKDNRELHFC